MVERRTDTIAVAHMLSTLTAESATRHKNNTLRVKFEPKIGAVKDGNASECPDIVRIGGV